MSDQNLATQVEDLPARQDQTDESLVALAGIVETLVDEVKANPLSGSLVSLKLAAVNQVLATIKQRHQRSR